MATSAFKSTTKRASLGGGSTPRSSTGRSRSVSRPHRPVNESDYVNAPRGKFVNTTRGSTTPTFTEISLDDLALEFFSDSQSSNSKNDSVQADERKGRSASRNVERWASDTASSSRRRVRSVSRPRGSGDRDVQAVSGRDKSVNTSRRRSMSVARYQISDSESDAGQSRNSRVVHANQRARAGGIVQMQNQVASSNRRLARSQSQKDLSRFHDGYSSHSSALTDDESKDTHIRKNGFEKTIRAVYSQKKVPSVDATDAGLYEAMRKELRYAVDEIRTEVNQAVARSQTTFRSDDLLENYDSHLDLSGIREGYATKFEQLEARKTELLKEMLLEEQRGREGSRISKEHADPRISQRNVTRVAARQSRSRKRSSDRGVMTNDLTDEAEKYIEEFISNLEDTDLTSFDGEISDGSSTFGGSIKTISSAKLETETHRTPEAPTSHPVEMDGVVLPWLKWETSHDTPFAVKNNSQTPVTPKTLHWDSEKDIKNLLHDPTNCSISSYGSWSPSGFGNNTPSTDKREGKDNRKTSSFVNRDEYFKLQKDEDLLFEMYRERNRICSGGLLLCHSGFL